MTFLVYTVQWYCMVFVVYLVQAMTASAPHVAPHSLTSQVVEAKPSSLMVTSYLWLRKAERVLGVRRRRGLSGEACRRRQRHHRDQRQAEMMICWHTEPSDTGTQEATGRCHPRGHRMMLPTNRSVIGATEALGHILSHFVSRYKLSSQGRMLCWVVGSYNVLPLQLFLFCCCPSSPPPYFFQVQCWYPTSSFMRAQVQ